MQIKLKKYGTKKGLAVLIFLIFVFLFGNLTDFREIKKILTQPNRSLINQVARGQSQLNQLTNLANQLKNLNTSLSNINGQLNNLVNQLTGEPKNQLSSFYSQLNNLTGQFGNLTGQLTELANLSNLSGLTSSLMNQLNNLTSQFGNLAGQLDGFVNQLSGLSSQLSSVLSSALLGQLNNLTDQFGALSDQLSGLSDQLGGLSSDLGGGGETPFGGMRTFSLRCTCSSPNQLLYIQDYASNQLKKLLYVPGTSKIYDHQNPTGATYLLGSYSSGGQSCRIRVGKYCITIQKDGQLGSQPGTGTSQ